MGSNNKKKEISFIPNIFVIMPEDDSLNVRIVAIDDINTNGVGGMGIFSQTPNDKSGSRVHFAGDLNNDGIDDFLIGAKTHSYVFFGSGNIGKNGNFNMSVGNMNGRNGFAVNARIGYGGDFNGDKIHDLLIGPCFTKVKGGYSVKTYVMYGKSGIGGSGLLDVATLSENSPDSLLINNFVNESLVESYKLGQVLRHGGFSVECGGDVNRDGFSDVIVKSWQSNRVEGRQSCTSCLAEIDIADRFIIYGGKDKRIVNIQETKTFNGLKSGYIIGGNQVINNIMYDVMSVTASGDNNNDGFGDLIIGLTRRHDEIYYNASEYDDDTDYVANDYIFEDENITSVPGEPTMKPTETPTLRPTEAPTAFPTAKAGVFMFPVDIVAFLLYGADNVQDNAAYATNSIVLNATKGLIIHGEVDDRAYKHTPYNPGRQDAQTYQGYAFSNGFDFNGDGIDDVLLGTQLYLRSTLFVVFGTNKLEKHHRSLDLVTLVSTKAGVVVSSDQTRHTFKHFTFNFAGDVNQDGISDLIIGFPEDALEKYRVFPTGLAYVVFGGIHYYKDHLILHDMRSHEGYLIRGEVAHTWSLLGTAVGLAGDVNGDGISDIIIGAPGAGYSETHCNSRVSMLSETQLRTQFGVTDRSSACSRGFGKTWAGATYVILGAASPQNLRSDMQTMLRKVHGPEQLGSTAVGDLLASSLASIAAIVFVVVLICYVMRRRKVSINH